MFTRLYRLAFVVFAAGMATSPVMSQSPAGPDRTIDAAERTAVIDGVLERVVANYVFPDVGKKMAEAVRARQEKKEYDGITSGRELAETLTKHLREISKDKHLGVRLSVQPMPRDFNRGPSEDEARVVVLSPGLD